MNEAEWRKVLSSIVSDTPEEREEAYELVQSKFWNDEVLEKLKTFCDKPTVESTEKVRYVEAIAAIGLEKGIPFLTKKRADIHAQIKEQGDDVQEDLQQLIVSIDASLKRIIQSTKEKVSLKDRVQKKFALK